MGQIYTSSTYGEEVLRAQFEVVDDIGYHVEPDKTLRIIPPTRRRQKLFEEAHSGGYLHEAKIHDN